MKIWIARHGQTDLNNDKRMQGLTDCLLNETGILQARLSRKHIGDVHFDAVYASPLKRAQLTASIIGNVDPSEIIIDQRLIETDFGKYEKCKYYLMGPAMTLYWMFPKIFPVPDTVETLEEGDAEAASTDEHPGLFPDTRDDIGKGGWGLDIGDKDEDGKQCHA